MCGLAIRAVVKELLYQHIFQYGIVDKKSVKQETQEPKLLDLKFQVIEIVIKLTLFGNSGIEKKQTPTIPKTTQK